MSAFTSLEISFDEGGWMGGYAAKNTKPTHYLKIKSKRNWIWSNRNRNRNHACEFGFGLAENRNLIFGFGLGYAEIGYLAEISAETEI